MATTRKKKLHDWIEERSMETPSVVLRIDDYGKEPLSRGQFYPENHRYDDVCKAVWPTRERAIEAAEWAVKKFGKVYGVFTMVNIVQPREPEITVTDV